MTALDKLQNSYKDKVGGRAATVVGVLGHMSRCQTKWIVKRILVDESKCINVCKYNICCFQLKTMWVKYSTGATLLLSDKPSGNCIYVHTMGLTKVS